MAAVVCLPLASAVAAAFTARARALGTVATVAGLGTLAVAVVIAIKLGDGHTFTAAGGFMYLDPLSGFFMLTIAIVVALASMGSAAYMRAEEAEHGLRPLQVRLYFVFFALFASMMLASFATGNLGLLWVLIEASTLASCVLVGLEADALSLEAAWKYIIISSFGVTIALAGTVFLYYSASSVGGSPTDHLTWQFLHAHAARPERSEPAAGVPADRRRLRHEGRPGADAQLAARRARAGAEPGQRDAVRRAAEHGYVRDRPLPGDRRPGDRARYASHVLLVFGFLSIVVGTLFIVLRGNFKRMFAYSSVEHMGIITVALGFGGTLGLYGALLQTLTHAIGKTVLFLTSGDVLLRFRTRLVSDVHGLLGALPVSGVALVLGSVAVAGSPRSACSFRADDRPRGLSERDAGACDRAAGAARGRVHRAGRRDRGDDVRRGTAAGYRPTVPRSRQPAGGGYAARRRPDRAAGARALDPGWR